MDAAKIIIEVVAGLIPNEPMPEHSHRFIITSKQLEDSTGMEVLKTYGFAQEYMRTLWHPGRVNWVRCDWIYL
jgi:hypothetical protein